MTVGVRHAQLQGANCLAERSLQAVVDGRRSVLLQPYVRIAQERAEEIRIAAASDVHVHSRSSGYLSCWIQARIESRDRNATRGSPGTAIVGSNRFAVNCIRVQAGRDCVQLV